MKRAFTVLAITFLMNAAVPVRAQSPRADAGRLLAACEQHCHDFDVIYGNSLYYGGPVEEARQALATVEKLERDVLPGVQPVLALFAGRYGTTGMEVSNAFHRAGVTLDTNIGVPFDEPYCGVSNLDRTRRA